MDGTYFPRNVSTDFVTSFSVYMLKQLTLHFGDTYSLYFTRTSAHICAGSTVNMIGFETLYSIRFLIWNWTQFSNECLRVVLVFTCKFPISQMIACGHCCGLGAQF